MTGISKKIIILQILLSFCICFKTLAQTPKELMLDMDSSLAKIDIPVYEGTDYFEQRLEEIRTSQGREPLGLILCGGSARAFAHIGVLKAMEENNVTPDFIVANSMGAIIGMLYAYGFSPDKIQEVINNINITSYFEPVAPTKGGLISVRNFRALVNDLLGNEYTDIKDCPIPIIITTEDLITKRQIYHASGDFAKIMTGAFCMPAAMEPTHMKIDALDESESILMDSGSIDIASLSVAATYSENLIVSTAFYDTKLNFDNCIVDLNRMFSIAKERIAVKDIKNYRPVIIRNQVESFSFMEFDKSLVLSEIGYRTTIGVMDNIKALPHGYDSLDQVRIRTDKLADDAIKRVTNKEPLKYKEAYLNAKLWPIIPSIDYPDFILYDSSSIAAFLFYDTPYTYSRLGANFQLPGLFATEGYFQFKPSSIFELDLLSDYGFTYDGFKPDLFYGAMDIKIRPSFMPGFFEYMFITGEYQGDYTLAPQEMMYQAGFDFKSENDYSYYVELKPFYYITGQDFGNLSQGIGSILNTSANLTLLSKKSHRFSAGITENASVRYAISSFNPDIEPMIGLYKKDYFRDRITQEVNRYVITSSSEVYFVNLSPNLTVAELIIFKQLKTGAFFDLSYTGSFNYCSGGFARTKISLFGLCDFTLEGGCGWNFSQSHVFGFFNFKNHI